MKANFVIFLLIINSFQAEVPPQKVANALKQKFPSAENIVWYKGRLTKLWEANFELNKNKATASFTSDAKWLETTLEIPESELIEIIKSAVTRDYPKCKILSAVINESKSFTWYLVKIQCGNNVLEESYDYHGMSIKNYRQ
jgi:hypothetical protein